tara:strand:+ start:158 stop:652 length:495 start_codon:yes stop_codon:yes gene_type:complete
MKKNLLFVIFIIFTISASTNSYASYEGYGENMGREGPPPAGPYRLGYKELERAIKTEKKGKIKKAKIKYEKALEYFLKANAENPANPDIFNYLGICNSKLGLNENAEIYYLLGLELDNQHKGIKFNLGTFYLSQNRINDSKEILTSLKDCGCEEYETLKMLINK